MSLRLMPNAFIPRIFRWTSRLAVSLPVTDTEETGNPAPLMSSARALNLTYAKLVDQRYVGHSQNPNSMTGAYRVISK